MNNEPVSYVTAVELANMMQEYSEQGFMYPLCMELKYVAVMLRQQADRIADLEKENKEFKDYNTERNVIEHDLNNQIYRLEQQIKDALEIGIAEGFAKALTQYPPVTTPQTKDKE